jgi:hypothetical protein|nr:MAG TPA_asm: hypothetical protein [Caudoviricetes sp.]
MDHRIIDIQLPLPKGNDKDPITLAPTFYRGGNADDTAYLKFNNAVKRMSEPREVERTEVDVEFVIRNDAGSLYAVVYHYADGRTEADMLVKARNGYWAFHRAKMRFHPNFLNAYIPSIWGYKRLTELQIAQELSMVPVNVSKMMISGNNSLTIHPGGINVTRCNFKNGDLLAIEEIDFIAYEDFDRDEIKDFYHDVLNRYVLNKDVNIEDFPEDLIKKIVEESLESLKRKYGK